jgi:hypothetical protein
MVARKSPFRRAQAFPEFPSDDASTLESPHASFPKPLGLSYRNFHAYFSQYRQENGEQMEVASRLVAAMLEFYFPRPTFAFYRLGFQQQSLVATVPVLGTIYWVVKARAKACREHMGPGKETEPQPQPQPRDAHTLVEGNEAAVNPGNGREEDQMVLLLAIVTDREFRRPKAREQRPAVLTWTPAVAATADRDRAHVSVAGNRFESGQVVVLGSRYGPVRPIWEFYTYNSRSRSSQGGNTSGFENNANNTALLPWVGQTGSSPAVLARNTLSFAAHDVENLHEMFRRIIACADGDGDLAVPLTLDAKREALADVTANGGGKPASVIFASPRRTDRDGIDR